ncbi:hypothetical protein WA026_001178 [Henosepilachna vigintioctopunctata]
MSASSRRCLILILLIIVVSTRGAQNFNNLKERHNTGHFTNNQIQYLASLQDDKQFDKYLKKILIPRVVGTNTHEDVYKFIKGTLKDLEYSVEVDEFVDNTPFGNFTFKNIIATLDPDAERFFVVAAHYDSKFFQEVEFLGATDSAVPCAMMLQMAKTFKDFNFPKKSSVSLKFIFFDGEEAFVEWGPKDSIYGARHLAKKMHKVRSRSKLTGEMVTDLERLDCLMLLDLLGHANPTIFNYFEDTKNLFNTLSNAEKKLQQLGLLKKQTANPYFIKRARSAFIEDDHIPFYRKDVPILHIIPVPFPNAWHTVYDNADNLDASTIHDLSLTIQLFVAQYLHV